MMCFDSYRFKKQKGGKKEPYEPFQHKRVLQNAILNKTITACKEPLKNHIFESVLVSCLPLNTIVYCFPRLDYMCWIFPVFYSQMAEDPLH